MKRIKIERITQPDKTSVYTRNHYYNVFLNFGKTFYFKNEVKAKRFIAETNRFYNSTLHEYNYIYAQLLIEYRNLWFYVDDRFTNVMQLNITNVERSFNMVINKCKYYENGNPLTFQYLININNSLRDIALSLRNVNFEKDYYHDLQRIDIFINQLSGAYKKLDSWGNNFDGIILDVK